MMVSSSLQEVANVARITSTANFAVNRMEKSLERSWSSVWNRFVLI